MPEMQTDVDEGGKYKVYDSIFLCTPASLPSLLLLCLGVRMRSISSIIPGNDSFPDNQNTISHRVKNAANALDNIR